MPLMATSPEVEVSFTSFFAVSVPVVCIVSLDWSVIFPFSAVTAPLMFIVPAELAFTFHVAVSLPDVCIVSLDWSVILCPAETSPSMATAPLVEVIFA